MGTIIALSAYQNGRIFDTISLNEIVFLVLIAVGIVLCFLRLLKGPTAPDRAVAVDTAATITTALLVVLGSTFGRYVYLDVALVYAILTFIGSVAIARFLEKGI